MSCQIRYVVMIACMFLTVFATVLHSLSAQEMEYPIAAAATEDGAIYVADIDVPAIWKIKDGKIEKYFEGSKKYRTPLNRVRSLAIDRDGKLLAGDSAMREVYRFDDSAQPVPLTKGGIGIPRAIAVLQNGDLMVSDQELHCIWKVPAAGGDPVLFVEVPGIIALCADKEDQLWITSSPKHDLRRVSTDGKIENIVSDGPLEFPQDVTVDDAKNVFVADNYAKTIWKIAEGKAPEKFVTGDPLISPVGITRLGDKLIVTDPRAKALFQIDSDGKITKISP